MTGAAAVAPGLLIAGRYRLQSPVPDRSAHPVRGRSASRIGQLWQAHDEVLARAVAVLLVPDDDPDAPQVLAGARAIAGLSNPSLAKVYDAGQAPGITFVVTEYFDGDSLEHHLRTGPLEPAAAVDLVAAIADAIAAAQRVGVYGLTPTPSRILFTTSGLPRLAGVALVDDITDGLPEAAETSAQAETIALAFLLYAALTARWPGDPQVSALPPAPLVEGHLRTPRMVRGGVPREVDAVVTQVLGDQHARRGLPEISSPAAFAAALEPLRSLPEGGHPYGTDTAPLPVIETGGRLPRGLRIPARRRHRIGAGIGAVVLAVAVGGMFWRGPTIYPHFITHSNTTPTPSSTATTAAQGRALTPKQVSEFDPYGDHTDPHVKEAPFAIDGDPSTAWHTQTFAGPNLGNIKPGVGLLVDFGGTPKVSAVRLHLLGTGTTVQLLESNGSNPPTDLNALKPVATKADAGDNVTLRLSAPTSARYWVVWFTKLPAADGGYRGGVAEMTFES